MDVPDVPITSTKDSFHIETRNTSESSCVPYTIFRGARPPPPQLGNPGDLYIDTTVSANALYGLTFIEPHQTDAVWKRWAGPHSKDISKHVLHPTHPSRRACVSNMTIGWKDDAAAKGKKKVLESDVGKIVHDALVAKERKERKDGFKPERVDLSLWKEREGRIHPLARPPTISKETKTPTKDQFPPPPPPSSTQMASKNRPPPALATQPAPTAPNAFASAFASIFPPAAAAIGASAPQTQSQPVSPVTPSASSDLPALSAKAQGKQIQRDPASPTKRSTLELSRNASSPAVAATSSAAASSSSTSPVVKKKKRTLPPVGPPPPSPSSATPASPIRPPSASTSTLKAKNHAESPAVSYNTSSERPQSTSKKVIRPPQPSGEHAVQASSLAPVRGMGSIADAINVAGLNRPKPPSRPKSYTTAIQPQSTTPIISTPAPGTRRPPSLSGPFPPSQPAAQPQKPQSLRIQAPPSPSPSEASSTLSEARGRKRKLEDFADQDEDGSQIAGPRSAPPLTKHIPGLTTPPRKRPTLDGDESISPLGKSLSAAGVDANWTPLRRKPASPFPNPRSSTIPASRSAPALADAGARAAPVSTSASSKLGSARARPSSRAGDVSRSHVPFSPLSSTPASASQIRREPASAPVNTERQEKKKVELEVELETDPSDSEPELDGHDGRHGNEDVEMSPPPSSASSPEPSGLLVRDALSPPPSRNPRTLPRISTRPLAVGRSSTGQRGVESLFDDNEGVVSASEAPRVAAPAVDALWAADEDSMDVDVVRRPTPSSFGASTTSSTDFPRVLKDKANIRVAGSTEGQKGHGKQVNTTPSARSRPTTSVQDRSSTLSSRLPTLPSATNKTHVITTTTTTTSSSSSQSANPVIPTVPSQPAQPQAARVPGPLHKTKSDTLVAPPPPATLPAADDNMDVDIGNLPPLPSDSEFSSPPPEAHTVVPSPSQPAKAQQKESERVVKAKVANMDKDEIPRPFPGSKLALYGSDGAKRALYVFEDDLRLRIFYAIGTKRWSGCERRDRAFCRFCSGPPGGVPLKAARADFIEHLETKHKDQWSQAKRRPREAISGVVETMMLRERVFGQNQL